MPRSLLRMRGRRGVGVSGARRPAPGAQCDERLGGLAGPAPAERVPEQDRLRRPAR
ncbi:hypothetical protein AB0945_14595 [Streptomyces sp. NPDC005474]|uniref:hypothetical protein n=1 Tax=Streptomyces sp. NPDC005474 TaxID=3154878 RepID=UPI00345575A2